MMTLVPSCAGLLSHAERVSVMQALYSFGPKMKVQAVEQLKALETWVERQATGLDMATNPEALKQSFDKLLKVGHALLNTHAHVGSPATSPVLCVTSLVCL